MHRLIERVKLAGIKSVNEGDFITQTAVFVHFTRSKRRRMRNWNESKSVLLYNFDVARQKLFCTSFTLTSHEFSINARNVSIDYISDNYRLI